MIRIEDLSFTYPGASKETLSHINLHVEKGDFLAVIGNNGCGKSTFCKTLNGLIPNFIAGDMQGRILIDGLDTREKNVGEIAQKIGYVYQDFENQIVRPTVLDDASFACMNYAMEDYLDRGRKALHMCGLEGKEEDFIWQLSGGQKHLLALSGAVALRPDIIVLDEPIAQLDPFHAKQTYEILRKLNDEYGKTIIVIEHHTEYIAEYCKNAMLMREGQVMWKLPAREALRKVEDLEQSNIFPPQVTVAAKCLQQKGILENCFDLPTTVQEGYKVLKQCHLSSFDTGASVIDTIIKKENDTQAEKSEIVVSFENIGVGYRAIRGERKMIFDEFNLSIHRGEKIALIGSNGAGKSTMMKLMIGLMKASEGKISLNGISTQKLSTEELAKMISMVYQNPEEMFIKDTIESDISYAMRVRNIPQWEERTKELLDMFNLTDIKDRDGRLLSGGQMRRASLAIGIALNPEILLLDEPTANLDIATRHEIMKTLEYLKNVTETVMIATHDMQLVCQWAERIIVLCQGKIIADGTRDEIFSNEEVIRKVGIRPPEIYQLGKALDAEWNCYTIEEFVNQYRKQGEKKYVSKAV